MIETRVFDGLFSPEFQDDIETLVLQGNWKFTPDVSGVLENPYPSYGFAQMFKHPLMGVVSPLYESVVVPIVNELIAEADLHASVSDIHFTRAFLQLPLQDKFHKEHNGVHVDLPMDHIAVVYYVNDSDGDTIIYEQNTHDTPPSSQGVKLIEHKRVSPKKGRLVMFDGSRYHCSSQPRSCYRSIINMDLV